MNGLACVRAAALWDRRGAGLSNADALRLEEHLQRCEQCEQDFARLDRLRALSEALPEALPQMRRERAIEAALAQGLGARAAAGRETSGGRGFTARPVLALSGLALAAAAAFALVLARPWASAPAPSASAGAANAGAATGDRVLQGAVEIDGRPGIEGAALPARATLHATRAATVALAHGRLELAAGTTLRWDADTRHVALEHGSVTADVDARAQQRFSVQTRRFTVRVLGTRFTVGEQGVSVERGKVAVLAPDGAVLLAALTAGQRFSVNDAAASATATAPAATTSADATLATNSTDRLERTGAQARALLARARAQLAAGDAGAARSTVDDALALSLSRSDRAEALSLRAECALVARDLGGAIAGYLRVSRSYGNLPAGQNALFAAARLQAERGQKAAAIELLRRYLARHPRGRFVHEARERLAELDPELRSAP